MSATDAQHKKTDLKTGIPAKALTTLANLELEIRKHDDELVRMTNTINILDARVEAPYVVSDKYHVWHTSFPWLDVPRKEIRTHCGWSYGKPVFDRRVEVPPGLPRKPANKTDESLCLPADAPDDDVEDVSY